MATKDYSSKQEGNIAEFLDWQVVPGSGATACIPGDIRSANWLGECKTHTSPGKKIQFFSEVWDKIAEEATSKYKYPAYFVDDGSQRLDKTWVMFDIKCITSSSPVLTNYPFTVRKNISFEHNKLWSYKLEAQGNNSTGVVFFVNLNNKELGLTDLYTFERMFGY